MIAPKQVLVSLIGLGAVVYCYLYLTAKLETEGPRAVKRILLWNAFFSAKFYNFGNGSEPFVEHGCEQINCYVTNERTKLPVEQFDAIVIHGAQYMSKSEDYPAARSPNQIYVYYSMESPINRPAYSSLNAVFNLTMTHRMDSDIHVPYFYVLDREGKVVAPSVDPNWMKPEDKLNTSHLIDIFNRKSKPVAWFTSNCRSASGREALANELRQHIEVDVYGACGDLKCSHRNDSECFSKLEQDYFFYLSYENSLCRDYITEKVANPMQHDTIPIVYTGANITRNLPPGSYIDASQYTGEELADLVRHLMKNPDEYLAYFWWRDHYKIVQQYRDISWSPFCDLCKILNDDSFGPKIYDEMGRWWNGPKEDSICRKP